MGIITKFLLWLLSAFFGAIGIFSAFYNSEQKKKNRKENEELKKKNDILEEGVKVQNDEKRKTEEQVQQSHSGNKLNNAHAVEQLLRDK